MMLRSSLIAGTRILCRAARSMALALPFLSWASQPLPPVRADALDPSARVQVVVKDVYIHDEREFIGDGEMALFMEVWRCDEGHKPPCYNYSTNFRTWDSYEPLIEGRAGKLVKAVTQFSSGSGETNTLNRLVPQTDDSRFGGNTSEDLGFAIYSGEHYVVGFAMWELDEPTGATPLPGFQHDYMGEVLQFIDLEENGLGLGTHKERSFKEEARAYGDFTITYEVRATPLPDFMTTIRHVGGGLHENICGAVQNVGAVPSGAAELTIRVDGELFRSPSIPPLDVNATSEYCVDRSDLPDAEHMLSFKADEKRLVGELDELNNFYEHKIPALTTSGGPQAAADPGSGSTVANPPPEPAKPDLTALSVRIQGKEPSGANDCDPGKNDVIVLIKNQGEAPAPTFVLRLQVDDESADAVEKNVPPGLVAGGLLNQQIDDVQLKKGEHQLIITLDPGNNVSESRENNNELKLTVSCKNEGD